MKTQIICGSLMAIFAVIGFCMKPMESVAKEKPGLPSPDFAWESGWQDMNSSKFCIIRDRATSKRYLYATGGTSQGGVSVIALD